MKRISSALAALTFSLAVSGAPATSPAPLVSYSFDDQLTETGPDTFAVFQNAKGQVRLVSQIRYSGYRSIELRDVAGDGHFPELQGYFPERKNGELFFHFAMLVANPEQQLNVALAGPSHFSLTENGVGFWLKTIDGVLHHYSDSIPKKLFRVEPFVWYVVDMRADITKGTYDLTIRKEGLETPIVALKDQPNAVNTPGSSVDKFSFVGSVFEDNSDVTFYVDDVILGTDEKVILGPLVAPGRRKLFIDRWRETRALMAKSPGCPPMLSLADLGVVDVEGTPIDSLPVVKSWVSACAMMENDAQAAANKLAALSKEYPSAPILAVSEVMALIRAKQRDAAIRRWNELEPLLANDLRYGMLAAIAGMNSGDLTSAEQWLRRAVDEVPSEDVAEQYYFVLLWKNELNRAADLARRKGWPEREADALFLSGSPAQARPLYEEALRRAPHAYWPAVKLSDVFFALGDTAHEKLYREKMYGRLTE